MTLIYQITDTHVSHEEDKLTRKKFVELMEYVGKNPADILVITGDLPGEDGDIDIYRWMRSQLPAGQRTCVIPGNHDNDANLYEAFGEEICVNSDFFHTIELEEIDIVFTNTGSGNFPLLQLRHLARVRSHSVLFTHYPTRKISDGYMDTTYPLEHLLEVDAAIAGSNISHVFCGHFHTDHKAVAEYDLHVTPSPAFEVNLHESELSVSKARLPIRRIEINGTVTRTEVMYLDS